MNTDVYIRECLNRRLLPMIQKHKGPVLFWPDLASMHYSKATMAWYRANKVKFVPKYMNPPNCPEARPIETFWALTKTQLRKNFMQDMQDGGQQICAEPHETPKI